MKRKQRNWLGWWLEGQTGPFEIGGQNFKSKIPESQQGQYQSSGIPWKSESFNKKVSSYVQEKGLLMCALVRVKFREPILHFFVLGGMID